MDLPLKIVRARRAPTPQQVEAYGQWRSSPGARPRRVSIGSCVIRAVSARWPGSARRTDDAIRRAGQEGVAAGSRSDCVLVSEHSETLVELDRDYRRLAEACGVPAYYRAPAVGAPTRALSRRWPRWCAPAAWCDLLAAAYLWIKALHILSVVAWMAGLLYLPRLFVYHADAAVGSDKAETFKVMERRLLRGIMPAGGDRHGDRLWRFCSRRRLASSTGANGWIWLRNWYFVARPWRFSHASWSQLAARVCRRPGAAYGALLSAGE